MENDLTGFCSTVIKEKNYVCCRKSCRIKTDLLLIYSFCIKNLYSYLYILQNGVVNTSLLKHFQNETLQCSYSGGHSALGIPYCSHLCQTSLQMCAQLARASMGPAPLLLVAGNTGH